MKILLVGSSQTKHVEEIYKHLGYECWGFVSKSENGFAKLMNVFRFLRSDLVYAVGGFDVSQSMLFRLGTLLRKKQIIHWIGTDVIKILESYKEYPRKINSNCINIAGSMLLQEELKTIGIESEVVPIVPADMHFDIQVMPRKHAVVAYIPKGKEEFYGMTTLLHVAKCFSDIPFYVVANDGADIEERLDNVFFEGMLNSEQMKQLYERSSVLFRFPEHDGLSMMVLEALGMGKQVVYKYNFPHVLVPDGNSMSSIIKVFEKVFSKPPEINKAAADYIASEFSMERRAELYRRLKLLSDKEN